jgi:prevent-host-death family protein
MVAQRASKEPARDGDSTGAVRRVGLRELKERLSEIVRQVEEDGEAVDITRRGAVIARVVPVQTRPRFDREAFERRWAEHEAFARHISDGWPEGVTAVDAIRDVRE